MVSPWYAESLTQTSEQRNKNEQHGVPTNYDGKLEEVENMKFWPPKKQKYLERIRTQGLR